LGRSANVGAAVPYPFGHLQGYYRGEFTQIYRSGLADSYARFSINLYGAKAMNLKEFAGYRQRTNIGASVIVSAPTGQYDPGKAINLGANRWPSNPKWESRMLSGKPDSFWTPIQECGCTLPTTIF
jgi:hypothetical protein